MHFIGNVTGGTTVAGAQSLIDCAAKYDFVDLSLLKRTAGKVSVSLDCLVSGNLVTYPLCEFTLNANDSLLVTAIQLSDGCKLSVQDDSGGSPWVLMRSAPGPLNISVRTPDGSLKGIGTKGDKGDAGVSGMTTIVINANATVSYPPSGVTCSKLSLGKYKVVHNRNNANLFALVNTGPSSGGGMDANIEAQDANSLTISVWDTDQHNWGDNSFNLLLMMRQG